MDDLIQFANNEDKSALRIFHWAGRLLGREVANLLIYLILN
jgi:hypothetical protein